MTKLTFPGPDKRDGVFVNSQEEIHMASMTQTDRNQLSRYDLQDSHPRLTEVGERGTKILAALTLIFIGVLAALTYAAVQVFDGWHHLIVLADIAIIFFAIATWAVTRPPAEVESDTAFIPQGMRPTKKS